MAKGTFHFVSNGIHVLNVFPTREGAEDFIEKYQDEEDFDFYYSYSLSERELVNYPDEYEMLLSKDFFH